MVSKALVKRVRLSPQKARVVAKSLRGTKVESAVNNLKFSNTKASKVILKVLESAISNAEQNQDVDICICFSQSNMRERRKRRDTKRGE